MLVLIAYDNKKGFISKPKIDIFFFVGGGVYFYSQMKKEIYAYKYQNFIIKLAQNCLY